MQSQDFRFFNIYITWNLILSSFEQNEVCKRCKVAIFHFRMITVEYVINMTTYNCYFWINYKIYGCQCINNPRDDLNQQYSDV